MSQGLNDAAQVQQPPSYIKVSNMMQIAKLGTASTTFQQQQHNDQQQRSTMVVATEPASDKTKPVTAIDQKQIQGENLLQTDKRDESQSQIQQETRTANRTRTAVREGHEDASDDGEDLVLENRGTQVIQQDTCLLVDDDSENDEVVFLGADGEIGPVDEEAWAQAVKEVAAKSRQQLLEQMKQDCTNNEDGKVNINKESERRSSVANAVIEAPLNDEQESGVEEDRNSNAPTTEIIPVVTSQKKTSQQSHGFLINVESTKLIADDHLKNNKGEQAMMESGVGLSMDSSMRRADELDILEAKNRFSPLQEDIVREPSDSDDEMSPVVVKNLKLNNPSVLQSEQKEESPPLKQTIVLQSLKTAKNESKETSVQIENKRSQSNLNYSSSFRPQIKREKSNVDISDVYEMDDRQITFSQIPEEKNHFDQMGVKTSTDFQAIRNQQNGMNGKTLNTICIDGQSNTYGQTNINSFKIPVAVVGGANQNSIQTPYGFTLKQREGQMKQSSEAVLPTTDEAEISLLVSDDVNDYTQIKSCSVVDSRHPQQQQLQVLKSNIAINPILVEALKRTKQGKIVKFPIRTTAKNNQAVDLTNTIDVSALENQINSSSQANSSTKAVRLRKKMNLCVDTTNSKASTNSINYKNKTTSPKKEMQELSVVQLQIEDQKEQQQNVDENLMQISEKETIDSPKMKTCLTLLQSNMPEEATPISTVGKMVSKIHLKMVEKQESYLSADSIASPGAPRLTMPTLELSQGIEILCAADDQKTNSDRAPVTQTHRSSLDEDNASQNIVLVSQINKNQEIQSGVINLKLEDTPQNQAEDKNPLPTKHQNKESILIKSQHFNMLNSGNVHQTLLSPSQKQKQVITVTSTSIVAASSSQDSKGGPTLYQSPREASIVSYAMTRNHRLINQSSSARKIKKETVRKTPMIHIERIGQKARYPTPSRMDGEKLQQSYGSSHNQQQQQNNTANSKSQQSTSSIVKKSSQHLQQVNKQKEQAIMNASATNMKTSARKIGANSIIMNQDLQSIVTSESIAIGPDRSLNDGDNLPSSQHQLNTHHHMAIQDQQLQHESFNPLTDSITNQNNEIPPLNSAEEKEEIENKNNAEEAQMIMVKSQATQEQMTEIADSRSNSRDDYQDIGDQNAQFKSIRVQDNEGENNNNDSQMMNCTNYIDKNLNQQSQQKRRQNDNTTPWSQNHDHQIGVTIEQLQSVYPVAAVNESQSFNQKDKQTHLMKSLVAGKQFVQQKNLTKMLIQKPLGATLKYSERVKLRAGQEEAQRQAIVNHHEQLTMRTDKSLNITLQQPSAAGATSHSGQNTTKDQRQQQHQALVINNHKSSLLATSKQSRPGGAQNHNQKQFRKLAKAGDSIGGLHGHNHHTTQSMDSLQNTKRRRDKNLIGGSGTNSKASQLSIDLQHLEPYSPTTIVPNKRTKALGVAHHCREKTKSNFYINKNTSHKQMLLLHQDDDHQSSEDIAAVKVRASNNKTTTGVNKNIIDIRRDNEIDLKKQIQQNQGQQEKYGNKEDGVVQNNEMMKNQTAKGCVGQVQTSFEELFDLQEIQIQMEELL